MPDTQEEGRFDEVLWMLEQERERFDEELRRLTIAAGYLRTLLPEQRRGRRLRRRRCTPPRQRRLR